MTSVTAARKRKMEQMNRQEEQNLMLVMKFRLMLAKFKIVSFPDSSVLRYSSLKKYKV